MKTKSIKVHIAVNFVYSMLLAFISTAVTLIILFSVMHIISKDFYDQVLTDYNQNFNLMLGANLAVVVIFFVYAFLIFGWRMNSVTDYIEIIADSIHNIAGGCFSQKINVKSENELGRLADDINSMSDRICEMIENEKRWNDERYNMISNLSHDLKTPIMSIGGYAELIKNKKYNSEKEFDDYSEIISRKSEELNVSINQLFELSKINSNDFRLNKVKINVRQFIEQIMMSYIPQLMACNMECRIDIPDRISMETDPQLMVRVFENIISNTLKYASDGKFIDIKAKESDDSISVTVINYGPVIPENDLNNIFSKYYREKKNDIREGSGLGLAIARRIVELHGGSMSASSSTQKTEFRIELFQII